MSSVPKIAIIGAGPAGLTLARLLLLSSKTTDLDVTVYELDASANSRSEQGGTLDLHADTGLAAIRKCGLWDSFSKHARYDGQEMIMRDKNATEVIHLGGGKKQEGVFDRPEIDRYRLREILLDSIPPERISWGKHLREVTKDGKLKFDGGSVEGPFDLIVGADGAWSKVRARLSDLKPRYSGVSGYEMDIKKPAEKCPELSRQVGRGACFAFSERKALNCQRLGDDSLKVRSWFTCRDGEAAEILSARGVNGVLDLTFDRYKGWAPEILELLKQGDVETLRQWTLYELPVPAAWDHQRGFTLIGDAASLCTPFSGEGVNKAMKDALQLAEQLEQSQAGEKTMDEAVGAYERMMFPRAEKLQRLTLRNKAAMFESDTLTQTLTSQVRNMTGDNPSFFVRLFSTPPVLALAYGYFWIRQQIGWGVRSFWRRT